MYVSCNRSAPRGGWPRSASRVRGASAIASEQTPRPEPTADKKSALDEFDNRTATGDPGVLVTDAVETVVNSPSVGGVSNLSVETGAPAAVPPDSTVNLFPGAFMQMPIAIGFDARYRADRPIPREPARDADHLRAALDRSHSERRRRVD